MGQLIDLHIAHGRHPEGLTLEQLIEAVANAVGDWPIV